MNIRLDETNHGVRERVGTIVGTYGDVPFVLWTPEGRVANQLVLVGHGASGSKFEGYVVALARTLARQFGCASLAIDGPVHGDRRGDADSGAILPFLEFAQRWSSDDNLTDVMICDWRESLDAVLASGEVAPNARVGYWGLSMGTILGLPFVAAEPRVRAAVLGLMGTSGPTKDRLIADATAITIPTLFLLQWDDELINRDDGFRLFGLLGASDKTLMVTPGAHASVTTENFRRSAAFLADRLSEAPQGPN